MQPYNYVNSSCSSSHLKNCRCESSLNGLAPYSFGTRTVQGAGLVQWEWLSPGSCTCLRPLRTFPHGNVLSILSLYWSQSCFHTAWIYHYLMYTDFAFVLACLELPSVHWRCSLSKQDQMGSSLWKITDHDLFVQKSNTNSRLVEHYDPVVRFKRRETIARHRLFGRRWSFSSPITYVVTNSSPPL